VREDPRLPSSINPRVPPELDAIVLKSMSKNPANRYQSAAEMRNDLLRALAGQRVEATPVMGDAEKTTILAAPPGGYGYDDEDDWDDDGARRRKRRIIAIVAALAVLLIGGIVAAVLLNREPAPVAAAQVAVPGVLNQDQATAESTLTSAGLKVGQVTQAASAADQVGKVIETDPAGGVKVDEGTSVNLVVGTGPDAVTVPNVVGLTEDQAKANLQNAGFTGSISTREVGSLDPEGRVVSVTPDQGRQAAPNQEIVLGISTGTLKLPDVQGKTEAEARSILTDAGFSESQIVTQSVERDDVPQGTVVESDPGANSAVGAGQEITLLVAVPVPPQPTPTTTAPPTTTPLTTSPAVSPPK
jgi:serine/threonine-protein kinase